MKTVRLFGILGTAVFTLAVIWMMVITSGGSFMGIFDISVLLGTLICIPLLFVTGYAKDFANAFKVMFCDRPFETQELKRADTACTFLLTTLWIESVLYTLLGVIGLLNNIDGVEMIYVYANVAVAIMPLIYAAIISLFILSIKAYVERKLDS